MTPNEARQNIARVFRKEWAVLQSSPYFPATRHPWPCLLFLAPLFVAYEAGVLWLARDEEIHRTGVDYWIRWVLESIGLPTMFWLPAFIVSALFFWALKREHDRPRQVLTVLPGMAVESIAFGVLLVALGRTQQSLETVLIVVPTLARAADWIGAGIYEELLFRLLLYSALRFALIKVVTKHFAISGATLLSAFMFALAHYLGPYGEQFQWNSFLFRGLAGMYFGALYEFRGIGIAVGAHACYDVFVGVVSSP